jgi:hypothetical protein
MRPTGVRWLWTALANTAVAGFALSLMGCAHYGGLSPVMVSDVKSVAGTWKGVVYASNSSPESIALTIGEDGVYDVVVTLQPVGESRGKGQMTIKDGRLLFEGPKGRGMGTLLTNGAGDRIMNIEATLTDNSIMSARLAPSPSATK